MTPQYRGDLQMYSEWSDGYPTVQEIAEACIERGYQYAAVTDHSYGLKIAGGMSMAEAAEQRRAIEDVNTACGGQFRLLQGIEANIDAVGMLDLSDEEAATFDVVLAAPHSRLRRAEDQTDRMLAAIAHPAVRVLAHPRGRITGSRAGVVADWDAVFASAARRGVAIEIDGDPARQDLDHTLATRACDAGGGGDRLVRPGLRHRQQFAAAARGLRAYFETRLPVLSRIETEFAWEGLFAMTPDSLPYIGPHRRYPRQWFALGYGGNGMTFGFLAARLLLERWQGRVTRDHAFFEFGRTRSR